MKPSPHTVLISGAGQLGSRYLQGLAKCRLPLRIYVQDRYEGSLDLARQRWGEVLSPEVTHEVSFHSSFELLPRQLDIAVVATTADSRPGVVAEITAHSDVRFWVLEKVLAQSESGLDEIMSKIAEGASAWVNTPRRMMPWHQQIKVHLALNHPMRLKVTGGAWGLACNAIHFLDLFAWWTGEELQSVSTDRLASDWFESKRQGYWEVSGILEAGFSGGSRALLSAEEGTAPPFLEVSDGQLSWVIKETEGLAKRSDGMKISGRMVYQSEMSADLVEAILATGYCALPTLAESTALHRVFIRSMQEHWKRMGNPVAICVPIT
jgi:hypothetical protein